MALSPMMQQYFEIKEAHKDHILFFRLGDFYEMFFDDALLASRELELTLTGRDCGLEERAPMCGVPFHSYETYVQRLIEKGYKVAICEQTEDPTQAKGLVKREIVRVITPGTILESSMLKEDKNNFICSLYLAEGKAGLCFCDISTGELRAAQLEGEDLERRLLNEIGRFSPSEIVASAGIHKCPELLSFVQNKMPCTLDVPKESAFSLEEAEEQVRQHFHAQHLGALGLSGKEETVRAVGCLLRYLKATQQTGLERIFLIHLYDEGQYMNIDLTARRNLELTRTMRSGEKRGTLLWVLDKTKTAMGKRLIVRYLEQPLLSPALILRRLQAVEELTKDSLLREDLEELLGGIHDLERLMTRIVYGSANARDLRSLGAALRQIAPLKAKLAPLSSQFLQEAQTDMDGLEDVVALVERALVEEPPVSVREGGMIAQGFHARRDELDDLLKNAKQYLAGICERLREETGIKNLKLGYNKVFGYYLEVTKSYAHLVPDSFIRKQTLSGAERYITEELKELEGKILGANDEITALEYAIFTELREFVAAQLHRIQRTAAAVARVDVMLSFAKVAVKNRYCRPEITLDGALVLKRARHPVVEQLMGDAAFVANDLCLDQGENRVAIITGPNMAGKSTYMRQTALITLMAHIGSFVPCESARVPIVDAIFTRVGASDDLASGQSTFMVEMNEVATILKNATANSLILLDEIGRGTSTYDGMSIARAVVEHIADRQKIGAKTLFATHYHELTVLEEELEGVKNYNIAVKKRGDDITFLRKIVPGGADDSYGIQVAKLAGIDNAVVRRAKEILAGLEQGRPAPAKRAKAASPDDSPQISFADQKGSAVLDRLREVSLDTMTPVEAFLLLNELKSMLS